MNDGHNETGMGERSSSGTRRTVCLQWTITASCPITGMMPTVNARSRLPARATKYMSTEYYFNDFDTP